MAIAISVDVYSDPTPCAHTGITITGLGVGDSLVNVWRVADGERVEVQGYRHEPMNDAAYLEDWSVPLGRPVEYEVEVLSGPLGPDRATSSSFTVPSAVGYLQDALDPLSAVPVVGQRRDDGDIYLRTPALDSFEYATDSSIFRVMGSNKPMALIGERMAASGVDTSVGTRSAIENANLQALLKNSANLVFRPLPEWGDLGLAGTLYLLTPTVRRTPVNVKIGGNLTWWDIKSDVVQGPVIKVLTAIFTYNDVMIMTNTYADKLALQAGKTYLDDLKAPLG